MGISYAIFFAESQYWSYPVLLNSGLSFSLFILFSLFFFFDTVSINFSYSLFYGSLNICFFSNFFKTILLLTTILLSYVCKDFLVRRNLLKFEYDIIIMFSILGLLLLNCCDDFLMLYLAIELQSLCFYVLATFQKNSDYSSEAGLKYFVLGAFSSGLLLFGITLIYISFGTISFETISLLSFTSNTLLTIFGFFFILFAFLRKHHRVTYGKGQHLV
jgi:NADH-quinone oxidoreductase subunit N